ncbi:MAG: hypothetical protein WD118_10085 [Phycisphaeraceae bacterium]
MISTPINWPNMRLPYHCTGSMAGSKSSYLAGTVYWLLSLA